MTILLISRIYYTTMTKFSERHRIGYRINYIECVVILCNVLLDTIKSIFERKL
jgi:hypothetical protein